MIVVRDLKHGCLTSLDLYLRIHQGIPDREVAVELRKLLSGSRHRTKYRLEALPHPDARAKVGAPRKSLVAKPTQREFELADAFEEAKKAFIYAEAAIAMVREKVTESGSTINRAAKKVAKYRCFLAEQKAARDARTKSLDDALERLRQKDRE